jgi:hypothetical protein
MLSNHSGSAGSEAIATLSVLCLSGNTSVDVNTFNATSAAADLAFGFIAYRPGNTQILPASAYPDATECTMRGDVVECV